MKRNMTLREMIEKEPYKSIIELTHAYGSVTRLAYRWALIKDHDNIQGTYFIEKMTKFFYPSSDYTLNLESLYKLGLVKKDIIQGKYANGNLGNFLKRLVNHGILKVESDPDNIIHYSLTEKYFLLKVCYSLTDKIEKFVSSIGEEVTEIDIQRFKDSLKDSFSDLHNTSTLQKKHDNKKNSDKNNIYKTF